MKPHLYFIRFTVKFKECKKSSIIEEDINFMLYHALQSINLLFKPRNPYFERHLNLEHTSNLQDLEKNLRCHCSIGAIYFLLNYFTSNTIG